MPSTRPSHTTRRLIKIASLGLAGLLAGLLAGCSDAPPRTIVNTSYAASDTAVRFDGSRLPPNLDAVRVPPLKHAPSTRRLDDGSVKLNQPPSNASLYGS